MQGSAALQNNQNVAKTQAMGSTLNILNKGTQACDAEGKNCQSGFGRDDQFNLSRMGNKMNSTLGVTGQSFGASDGAGSLSSQTGALMISCTNTKVHTTVGVALKVIDCAYDAAGNAAMNYKLCTAPSRGFKVSASSNEVQCSTDPASPNYKPPLGKVCAAPTCDSEPENSLNGWTSVQTVQFDKGTSVSGTKAQKDANGLKLTMYPNPEQIVTSFGTDGESLIAVRVAGVQPDVKTKELKLATLVGYRFKRITKNSDITSRQSLPAGKEPPFVETMRKLQNDPLIPAMQQEVGKRMTPCIDGIYEGVGETGSISVCNPTFNKYGITPATKTAQVAAMNKACETKTQCIQELVKTSTYTTECVADIPLANKNCTTTTDYTLETLEYNRTRPTELCHEARMQAQYGCTTEIVDFKVTGTKLECSPKSFLCASWASSCCNITISCDASGGASLSHNDCCGRSFSYAISDFELITTQGIQANAAGARVYCSKEGQCYFDYENYYCNSPSVSVEHIPKVNSFSLKQEFLSNYSVLNSCSVYEAAK